MGDYFIFDPKILIRPPYSDCPKCREKDSYGILSIESDYYSRRCKKCWYDESYPLPNLTKQIIYLDQFVISNMMKSINPKIKVADKNNEYFRELFFKLEFLAKAHIIVCPDSTIHYDESIMSMHYRDIRSMYKHLSFETSFLPTSTINRYHFVSAFKKYLAGDDDILIEKAAVCSGYNEWKERFRIEIETYSEEKDRNQNNEIKQARFQSLQPVFERWKIQKPFIFNDIFMFELSSSVIGFINRYKRYLTEIIKANKGIIYNIDEFIGDETILLVNEMIEDIKVYKGCDDIFESLTIIEQFSKSNILLEIPNLRIECLLWAALARKAAAGQKNLNISIVNDIYAISSYMPYSNAIFIDKECYALLTDVDVAARIQCNTEVFSLSNKEEFLEYLDRLIAKVPKQHIELIKNVYGEDWLKPYSSMYKL